MLVLTTTATEVVRSFTTAPDTPEGSGLRIAASTPEPRAAGDLQLMTAAGPSDNDQVIEGEGARLFLEPGAARFLDDKVLDAQVDADGRAHFALGEQA